MTRPKVLIVEDDAITRKILSVRLRANNYETVYAVDGWSAVAAAAQELPDVILLDLGLPAGDGFTVMERLQEIPQLASIPVIVLTARERKGNWERAMAAGCYAFFQKPPDTEALLKAVQAAVGGMHPHGAPHSVPQP